MPDFVTILLSEFFGSCLFYSLAFTQVSFERAWRQKKKKHLFFFYEIGGISQRSTLTLLFLLQRDEVFLGIEGGKYQNW